MTASSNKSIVFCINNLGIGGAERVFIADANELYAQGYTVDFVILYGGEEKSPILKDLRIPNDRIYFLKAKSVYDYRAYKKLGVIIRNNLTYVLYATLHDATFVSRLIALFFPKLRLVTREANTTEFKSIRHKLADILMNWRVNSMIAVSKEVEKTMLLYQPWYKNKIQILYNGVMMPKVTITPEEDSVILLAVGSLTPKKNYEMMLDAFSNIAREFSQVYLRIVGGGVLKEKLMRYVQEKSIQDRVLFLGNLDHASVEEEYKKASIFLLSSDQEGCPNVLLEAMSFGIPSVATRVGAVPEIIDDTVSGLTSPRRDSLTFAEQIKKLILSEELRKAVGFSGREKIKSVFSNEVHIRQLKAILSL